MCLYAAKQASAQQAEPAAPAVADIKPLEIGDTIPDLPVVLFSPIDNNEETYIRSISKGKWIILEFWHTTCGTCIKSMPHLFDLQQLYNKQLSVIPVSRESVNQLSKFFDKTNSPYIDKVRGDFVSIASDTILADLFSVTSLPVTVIIDDQGVVQVVTTPQALNNENIAALLNSRSSKNQINPLVDIREFSVIDLPKGTVDNNKMYSVISGHYSGAYHKMVWDADSGNHQNRLLITNADIPKLYTIALGSPLPINRKRIILEMSPSRVRSQMMPPTSDVDGSRPNLFCYETIFPLALGRERVLDKMKNDLDFFFQLHGRIESRKIHCLALEVIDAESPKIFETATNTRMFVLDGRINSRFANRIKEVGSLPNGVDTYTRHATFDDVIWFIDEISKEPLPMIINDTGYEGRFDLDFPSSEDATLENIIKFLNTRGLTLSWVEREVDMFILTEDGYNNTSESLRLTDLGYIYSSTANQLTEL